LFTVLFCFEVIASTSAQLSINAPKSAERSREAWIATCLSGIANEEFKSDIFSWQQGVAAPC